MERGAHRNWLIIARACPSLLAALPRLAALHCKHIRFKIELSTAEWRLLTGFGVGARLARSHWPT